jgi:hypothetical protein
VRNKPAPVLTDYVEIPQTIIDLNKDVTLAADVMFVCGLGFMVSTSRKLKFTIIEHVPRRTKPILFKSLNKVFNIYNSRGFKVVTALMDREFEPLRSQIHGTILNTTAASEHVPEIERQIHVIKERARAIVSTLTFKNLPSWMIIELIHFVVLWLNAFPPSSDVSNNYSPRTIMTGTTLDYNKHCRLPLGAYVETHEDNDTTNTMVERARGAICIGPTANFQGSYNFFCLDTGRHVTRKQFREIPMPASVKKRVAEFALRDQQAGELVFTNRNGIIFTDETENEISGAGANGNEAASAGVDTNEHASSPHDEPPGIIMETEPTNLSQTMGAQLGVTTGVPQVENTQQAVIAGVTEGTHTEIPGVPGPPGGDTDTPGVPDGGTHNEIPGVSDGTTAETPEGDAAMPDNTTEEAP